MNWAAIGAIGEILGAIAVVATLFYLSRQISQNSKALETANERASSALVHEGNTFYATVFSQLASDGELASIYHRALANEPLADDEAVRFVAFINTYFAWVEDIFFQSKGQLLSDFSPAKGQEVVAQFYPYWGRLLETEHGRAWWAGEGPAQFVPEFTEAVNAAMKMRAPGDIM